MASFRNILSYYRPYWLLVLTSTLGISTFQLIDLVAPYTMGQILNVLSQQPLDPWLQGLINRLGQVIHHPSDKALSLFVLTGFIFLVTVVKAPIQPWVSSWLCWSTALKARRDHFHKSLEQLLSLPLKFYDDNNSGRISARITKGIVNHTWALGEVAGQLIPKLIRLTGILVIVGLIEWKIALVLLASFIFILSINLQGLRQIVKREKWIERYRENTESRTAEIVTNIKTVKAFSTELAELERQQRRINREFTVQQYRIHTGFVKLNCRQNTLVQLCVFSVLSFTLVAAARQHISLGHFITTFSLVNMAYAELAPMHTLLETLARRYPPMLHFHELMQHPPGLDSPLHKRALRLSSQPYKFGGKVHFHQLSFSYTDRSPVLHDLELLIESYQTVAIVGPSGSGKSTLVKLLFRYFEPSSGKILIDGDNIQALEIGEYRRRLAMVHQDVDIFKGTILDNLLYGNPRATFAQVRGACRIAQADKFIEQLPEGYFTNVGERGVRLSGGQKQRLGIARAILVDPDLLVFDEATSSLDSESEYAIQQALQGILGTRTTIIIAHRLSTIRDADKIVVLNQGRIVEVGNHEQLLQQQGLYARLYTLQTMEQIVEAV